MSLDDLKARHREDYGYFQEYRTRWADNDIYGHMNNSAYLFYYDSIVNSYLIEHCYLDLAAEYGEIGLVVHSSSNYFSPVAFPEVLDLGLRANRLGHSSVTYEIGVFKKDEEKVRAVGTLTHVFVDKRTRKPDAEGMTETTRRGLQSLMMGKEKAKL